MDQLKITRIIPLAYQTKLVMVPYLVGQAEAKNASSLIKILQQEKNEHEQKSFLKRIRKSQQGDKIDVIICSKADERSEQKVERVKQLLISIREMQLPKEPPLTEKQYEEWAKIWPVNFIRHQITREIKHKEQESKMIFDLLQKEESDYILFKDETVLGKGKGECCEGTIDHPIMRMLEQWPKSEQFTKSAEEWYYLTGIRLISRNNNICGMCSMALVHSRLMHIYLEKQPEETMDRIMGCPELNHQITMFLIK